MTDTASNGTPLDELTEEDWSSPYAGGDKFGTVAEEKLHSWTLDTGQKDETGNATDWFWWAARFDGDKDVPALRAGAILQVRSSGAVTAFRYDTVKELEEDWTSRVVQYAESVHSECTDGIECVGCSSCENA